MKLNLKWIFILSLVLVGIVGLTGCQAKTTEATQAQMQEEGAVGAGSTVETSDSGEITAEGKLVPEEDVKLSFASAGQVKEVLVREGERVTEGQVLAALDTTDAQLNVQQAEAELAAAQIQYDQAPTAEPARRQADITAATLALLQAQDVLSDLNRNASLQAARAQLALLNAQDALNDAQRARTNMNFPRANQTTIDGAKAFYELKEEELEKAKQAYNDVRDLPADDPGRNAKLLDQSNAQKARDQALATLNWYLGKNSEQDLAEAEAKLVLAQAELEVAQEELNLVKDGPAETDVALAKEKIANAQALLDLANAQPVEQQIALVKTRLDAAKARLELAKAQIDKLMIKAPFDGIVTSVDIKPGEWVMVGQPALVLADLDNLMVETTDLSEIDVVNVSLEQAVNVSVDALPELSLTGKVVSIGDGYEEARGDITYPVLIELDEVDPRLKWGMTVLVTFME